MPPNASIPLKITKRILTSETSGSRQQPFTNSNEPNTTALTDRGIHDPVQICRYDTMILKTVTHTQIVHMIFDVTKVISALRPDRENSVSSDPPDDPVNILTIDALRICMPHKSHGADFD